MLYEVAILEKPTKKEIEDEGKVERLVLVQGRRCQ